MSVRRAAVLGSPIAHSLSPVLHRTAYDVLGLDWTYDAIEVEESTLPAFIEGCGPEWVGLSLTMPLKTAVLPLLDEMSTTARVTGAANTVIFGEGRRMGDNTDVAGMVEALREVSPDLVVDRVAVIGGGATARSAIAAAARLGAQEVDVVLRSSSRAEELNEVGELLGLRLRPHGWDEAAHLLDAPAVISTVPLGAADHLAELMPANPGALLDVAYGARVPGLTAAWRTAGGMTADGLDLLLWQAADQVRLMTDLEPPVEAMRTALRGAAAGQSG